MMHMPACLCLHAAPCGQKSKFEDPQCYLCLSVWLVIQKRPKKTTQSAVNQSSLLNLCGFQVSGVAAT